MTAVSTDYPMTARPGLLGTFRDALRTRAVFARTLNELRALSDRELADIGLHRSALRRAAQDAARAA